ncbi:MAG: hypothetical protein OEW05_06525 [Candidatus Aminicenantes bacterium]|nr:hypothetical protein [Candidatus Aminicenantes bacterium]
MPKGLIRSAPIEKAGPDKDAAVTPRADAGPRLPSRMKERVDTIQKTFGAKAEADAAKADLEARGYEVVIREYCEPAIDPDNYYAELTAQKRWPAADVEEAERRAEEEEKIELARQSLVFKIGLAVFIVIFVILFLGLFGPHLLKACRVIF